MKPLRAIKSALALVFVLLWCLAEAVWSVAIVGKPRALPRQDDL